MKIQKIIYVGKNMYFFNKKSYSKFREKIYFFSKIIPNRSVYIRFWDFMGNEESTNNE